MLCIDLQIRHIYEGRSWVKISGKFNEKCRNSGSYIENTIVPLYLLNAISHHTMDDNDPIDYSLMNTDIPYLTPLSQENISIV